jgi:hypothetical protein
MSKLSRRFALFATFLLMSFVETHAGVIVDITQVGPNVVATGSGTLDVTDLTNQNIGLEFYNGPNLTPSTGALRMGIGHQFFDEYADISGPSSFGPGTVNVLGTGTGNWFGVRGASGLLFVPLNYVSGSPLSSTDTYANQTFSSLGLTPGTYTWTWGTGADADFFTINVVREPSTLTLAVIGAVAIIASGCARHSRHQRRQVSA